MKHMTSPFIDCLRSPNPELFDKSVEAICSERDLESLLKDCETLEAFWKSTDNLYLRVRTLVFLYYLHRYVIPVSAEKEDLPTEMTAPCPVPLKAHRALQERNFMEAIEQLLRKGRFARLNLTYSSGLASAYHALALQNLADQVRISVRHETGNQWMFRIGHPDDYPLHLRPELHPQSGTAAWLVEETPVRMDLSHSSWSDIFFLGMDRPEFAKVINGSIDLAVSGSETGPVPPCLSAFRVIDRPVIRLVSLDLECQAEVEDLNTLFDFGRDYLGLLKAAVIASGLVPPGFEGSRTRLQSLLSRLAGEGKGIELVSWVRDIPKGSRLAVSTNLLGSLIAACMRASGQVKALEGPLEEGERRTIASRAILGEWLGGSGGGWQDSGGVWPGLKLIEGCSADGAISDPLPPSRERAGGAGPIVSTDGEAPTAAARGALLPRHTRLDGEWIPPRAVKALEDSLILVHGGMAANVGPILEMVTERYLLRSEVEWKARGESLQTTHAILEALREGKIRELGRLTTEHFFGPLKTIIPWASNAFTERLIEQVSTALEKEGSEPDAAVDKVGRARLGEVFWGFWMLGGMSGGGMGFIVNPRHLSAAKACIGEILRETKTAYEDALPFAMDPVIYDFRINTDGSSGKPLPANTPAESRPDASGLAFLRQYYRFQLPVLLQKHPSRRTPLEVTDLNRVHALSADFAIPFLHGLLPDVVAPENGVSQSRDTLDGLLDRYGFDPQQHEQIREDLRSGRVGLSQNRLHPKTHVEDPDPGQLQLREDAEACRQTGLKALADGTCLVLTLAAGAGSRWTQGAGVVKALHPFVPLNGRFRNFLEVHAAKTFLSGREYGCRIPHVLTTSYLTHGPIHRWLEAFQNRFPAMREHLDLRLSEGKSVGLRLIPTVRDLHYAWIELPQERLDDQAQKMRDSVRQALMRWARESGEGADYRDNLPLQCLHPVGHWYEFPNLLLNGTLHQLLTTHPRLQTLLLHNVDTLGADLDPTLLGHHLLSDAPLTYEVIQRRFDDVGGGLALIDGHLRLVEGFALPREEDEFKLSFYNTLTTWIDLDAVLRLFGLDREHILDPRSLPGGERYPRIREAVRDLAAEMPTYLTLKETKKRWGRGQEDVFPILQFERLWGDMSAYLALRGKAADFLQVDRQRGQQLKDPAQLDAWSREGNREWLEQRVGRAFDGK